MVRRRRQDARLRLARPVRESRSTRRPASGSSPSGASQSRTSFSTGRSSRRDSSCTRTLDHSVGYAYKWNGQGTAKQTDATVVAAEGADALFDTGKRTVHWYYPSQQDCLKCHNEVAGGTLGPDNAQMYRTVAGHAKNQFDEFQEMGLFEAPPVAPKANEVLVTPYTSELEARPASATLDQKARSYLQANCAHCHQPNDGFIMSPFPNFDLRYKTALKDAKICNAPWQRNGHDTGSASTPSFVPGNPLDSDAVAR